MGMSDSETLAVIYNADNRWKKFKGRDDQIKRLQGIIAHVRSKKAIDEVLVNTDEVLVYGFQDLMDTETQLEWVIEGVLPVAGKGIIYGPPSSGKSTFCLRMSIAIATGERQFLEWAVNGKRKVLFMSFEMGHIELKDFFQTMKITPEQSLLLQQNFFLFPVGHTWSLNLLENKTKLIQWIEDKDIDVVIFDSLGTTIPGKINDDETVNNLNTFLNKELCRDRGVSYFFVHHPRKPQGGEFHEPQNIFDMFGSIYIGTNAQTVMCLWWANSAKNKNRLKLEFQKSRHTNGNQPIYLDRHDDLSFTIVSRDDVRGKRRVERSPAVLKDSEGKSLPGS
jgi:archaellum biogenesis ATPase FlaH